MKNEEIAIIIAELLMKDDIRIDVFVNSEGETEKVTIGKNKTQSSSLEQKCIEMMKKFNIPRHLIGYKYLITAIKMVYKDDELLASVTKGLYPEIAKVHKTSAGKVEHGIRHAILKAYENDTKVFKEKFPYRTKRPTNSEFIGLVIELIRISE